MEVHLVKETGNDNKRNNKNIGECSFSSSSSLRKKNKKYIKNSYVIIPVLCNL